MRLSQLLLLGSTLLKPLRGRLNDHLGSGCALGMIFEAAGQTNNGRDNWMMRPYGERILPCGCDRCRPTMWGGGRVAATSEVDEAYDLPNMDSVIVHIFNQHVCATPLEVSHGIKKWTIEQLADWIESAEPQEAVSEPKQKKQTEEVLV